MFKKLQLKLILIYTAVLIAILLISNIMIFFALSSYNTNQLADDVERILIDINSSEWITESYDENAVPRDLEDEDESDDIDETDDQDDGDDTEDNESHSESEPSADEDTKNNVVVENLTDSPLETENTNEPSEQPEDEETAIPLEIDSIEDTEEAENADEADEPEETDKPEKADDPEETDTANASDNPGEENASDELEKLEELNDAMIYNKTSLVLASDYFMKYIAFNSLAASPESNTNTISDQNTIRFTENTNLYIPNILNSFSYYFIYSNSGELLRWKSSDSELLNQMYSISLALEMGQPPELIDLSNQGDGIFMVLKRPIIVDNVQLGYYTISENVSAAYNTLDNLKLIMILVTLAGSIMSLGIGYVFAGRVIRPIKEAYKTKEKFIGDASHELRIPLSIILLSMELLKRKNKDQSVHDDELIEDVEAEALNMKDLVDKLLFIARNDSKSIKLNYENVNLSRLIDENIEKFKTLRSEKNLIFNKKVEDNLIIQGDPKMIDSVVSILIDNAEKYNKVNGEISVEASKVLKSKKEYVKMIVRDTGIGIPEKDLDRIFERFHRQDKSRSREIPGYGLGLPIAKEILLLHQGTIEVESIEGTGSAFTVMFSKKI